MAITIDGETRNDSLTSRLRARIEREGPISFCDWMTAALYDERDGYYCRAHQVRQGRAGDYRTAPESSPLFAATFARYFSTLYSKLGEPPSWSLCEAGAGSGEFAYGVLTALQINHPQVFAATNFLIDEVSVDARSGAADRLTEFSAQIRFKRLSEIIRPIGPGIVFSNELIDALPVHRVTLRAGKLQELRVGISPTQFVWVQSDPDQRVEDYCRRARIYLKEGQVAEINFAAEDFVAHAASILERGFVITVDYGAERADLLDAPHRHQGTLRGFQRHRLVDDALSNPGEQDLTTTIDWTQVIEAGAVAGLEVLRFERLDQFLLDAGLLEELETRAGQLTHAEALRLRTSARELILPNGLAASFQVLVQAKPALLV
jgi:SAM-dependent MidA family methyltransferase